MVYRGSEGKVRDRRSNVCICSVSLSVVGSGGRGSGVQMHACHCVPVCAHVNVL